MAQETHQKDDAHRVADAQQEPAPLATVDAIALGQRGASRRRFTRAGAGATGVLLTLASQPGMASNVCMSMSGFHSYSKTMKLSSHSPPIACGGHGPDYWKAHWPNVCAADAMFHTVFSCSYRTSQTYAKTTCRDILSLKPFDTAGVGAYLMATFLNVATRQTDVMTIEQVRTIWKEYDLAGYYAPTAGVKWYAQDIVRYLAINMS